MNGFLNNLRYKTAEFMRGRNGVDHLTVVTVIAYAVISIFRAIFSRHPVAYYILTGVMTLLIVYAFFRVLSKNTSKRSMENEKFRQFWLRVKPKLVLFKDRIKDIKTKRYRTCPGCKNVLRLPKSRGKHSVRCPRCGTKFDVRIL